MKHTIRHGTVIDVPSTQEMKDTIAQAFARGVDQRRDSGYRREKQAIVLDGSGNGTITLRATRMYDWICQRVTCVGGAAGQVTFYENQVQDSDVMEVVQLSGSTNAVTDVEATTSAAAAAMFPSLLGVAGATTYLTGFEITGTGATASSVITVSITGVLGGTMNYTIVVPAGVGTAINPLQVAFTRPIPASGPNQAITVNVPSFGAGNTNATATVHGYQQASLGTTFRYSDSFSNTLFVPAGSQLLAVFTGCGAGAQASLNLQVHLIRTGN